MELVVDVGAAVVEVEVEVVVELEVVAGALVVEVELDVGVGVVELVVLVLLLVVGGGGALKGAAMGSLRRALSAAAWRRASFNWRSRFNRSCCCCCCWCNWRRRAPAGCGPSATSTLMAQATMPACKEYQSSSVRYKHPD